MQFTHTAFPTNHPWAYIPHFKIIDQDRKQIARDAREAIHIRINNHALKYNTEKMYILEIFNHLLQADRSSNDSDQMVHSDLPHSHIHFIIPNNRFLRAVGLTN